MNKDIKVFVVTHIKPTRRIKKIGYSYIGVGLNKKKLYCKYTDDKDLINNLSDKNDYYSELSAHYWIWHEAFYKYVGLMHYRRWFVDNNKKLLTAKQLVSVLNNYDVILPKKLFFDITVKERYIFYRSGIELDNTRMVLQKCFPEYVKTWDDLLCNHGLRPYNMLITSKKHFDDYSLFLFKVLFELENVYGKSVKRIYGYIGELLLDVYFTHNNFDIFGVDVLLVDKPLLRTRIKNKIRNLLMKN